MPHVVDDLFEIVTSELKINNAKNIIVSCAIERQVVLSLS